MLHCLGKTTCTIYTYNSDTSTFCMYNTYNPYYIQIVITDILLYGKPFKGSNNNYIYSKIYYAID